jgi:hypothetical protein
MTITDNNWKQGARVVLKDLKGASHLNGREGVVVSAQIIEATGRYEVQLSADDTRVKVKPANMMPLTNNSSSTSEENGNNNQEVAPVADSDSDSDSNAAPPLALSNTAAPKTKTKKLYRPKTYLTARPGEYKASYDWRAVLPGQHIPRGMEVLMALSHSNSNASDGNGEGDNDKNDDKDEPTLARIPRAWKLDVRVLQGIGKEYDVVRCEVERTTTMAGVLESAKAGMRGKKLGNVDTCSMVLLVDAEPWLGGDDATVEKAMLFGTIVSCRCK